MPSNTEAIAKSLLMLSGVFRVELDDVTTEAYMISLDDVSPEQIMAATRRILKSAEHKFMPTPGQLRELAVTDGRGSESIADAAWATLCQAVSRYGYTKSVNFRDALINAVVRFLGGWERICGLTGEQFDIWLRKDFCGAYMRFLQSGPPENSTRYLIGANERENAQWIGRSDWGRGGKVYQHAIPADVDSSYTPALLSAPAAKQLTQRPADMPRLELKKA